MRLKLHTVALATLLAAAPAAADPQQELTAAFGKAMAKGAFSATVQTEGRNATTVEMRVVLPNRFHMKTADTEMIILPQGTWMNANGQWMQFPMDMSKMIEGYSQGAIEQGMASLREVKVVGNDTIDGCASTVYGYRASGKFMGVNSNTEAEVAICDRTGLPVRVTTRDKKGKPEATVLYDFDSAIEIRPPN
jgi:hypothetical protein